MNLKQFCAVADLETFDCGPGWGGRYGIRKRGSGVSFCGYKTVRDARIAYIREECGIFTDSILAMLGEKEPQP